MAGWTRSATAVGALVLIATVSRAVGAGVLEVPWIVPDEWLYASLGESLWSEGTFAVRDDRVPYYTTLVPLLTGWPFAAFGPETAITVVQWLNGALISLAALPVYVWIRQLAGPRWALGAAALSLAVPGFLYSALTMSEALFVPLVVAALWALAGMLERPTALSAGVFLGLVTVVSAVRLQGVMLIPAAVAAAVVYAGAERSVAVLRRLLPFAVAGLAVAAAVLGALAASGEPLSWARVLGAYAVLAEEKQVESSVLAGLAWHLLVLALATLVLPLAALAALAWSSLGRGRATRTENAFVAVAGSWALAMVVQSALFATAYTGNAAERYLVSAAPVLMMALCVWCARGGPARAVAAAVALLGVVLGAVVPLDTIAGPEALVSNPFAAPLAWLVADGRASIARAAIIILALIGLAAMLAVRGRLFAMAPVAVGVGCLAISVVAYDRAGAASTAERESTVGLEDSAWLDRVANGEDVAVLATREWLWTAIPRLQFWNRTARRVLLLEPDAPSHLQGTSVAIGDDGTIADARDARVEAALVVAPATIQLAGEVVQANPGRGSATFPLRLWRTAGPLRVESRVVRGVDPVGDLDRLARIVVPACTRGALWITFLGKTETRVAAYVNGDRIRTIDLVPGEAPTVSLPTPSYVDGSSACTYDLDVPGFTGSTRLEFLRDG